MWHAFFVFKCNAQFSWIYTYQYFLLFTTSEMKLLFRFTLVTAKFCTTIFKLYLWNIFTASKMKWLLYIIVFIFYSKFFLYKNIRTFFMTQFQRNYCFALWIISHHVINICIDFDNTIPLWYLYVHYFIKHYYKYPQSPFILLIFILNFIIA